MNFNAWSKFVPTCHRLQDDGLFAILNPDDLVVEEAYESSPSEDFGVTIIDGLPLQGDLNSIHAFRPRRDGNHLALSLGRGNGDSCDDLPFGEKRMRGNNLEEFLENSC